MHVDRKLVCQPASGQPRAEACWNHSLAAWLCAGSSEIRVSSLEKQRGLGSSGRRKSAKTRRFEEHVRKREASAVAGVEGIGGFEQPEMRLERQGHLDGCVWPRKRDFALQGMGSVRQNKVWSMASSLAATPASVALRAHPLLIPIRHAPALRLLEEQSLLPLSQGALYSRSASVFP